MPHFFDCRACSSLLYLAEREDLLLNFKWLDLFPSLHIVKWTMNAKSLGDIDFEKRKGLLPVVVQDRKTKDILMLAYANKEALDNTIKTGNAWFWSTSRNKLWMKGEESGNVQPVSEILVDCDSDSILYMVDSDKPACHTGNRSCFHNLLT